MTKPIYSLAKLGITTAVFFRTRSVQFLMESYSSEASYLEGIIWREKTNIRLLNNEIAIGNLRPLARQLLPSNRFYGAVNATVAQAFINLKVLDSAQYYIAEAAQFENDKHLKGRYFFINGQLLEQLGKKEKLLSLMNPY